jgi:hypothetical protein
MLKIQSFLLWPPGKKAMAQEKFPGVDFAPPVRYKMR